MKRSYNKRSNIKRTHGGKKSMRKRSTNKTRKNRKCPVSKHGGYSKEVTKLILESKKKEQNKAARLTNTQNLKCPAGEIVRNAYMRTNKNTGETTPVAASCIKNRGLPGKAKKTIVMNENRDLGRYGYSNVKSLSNANREKALKEAVKAYGYVAVIRRLGAVAAFTTRTNTELSKKVRNDQHMVSKWYNKAKAEGLPPTPI